MRRKRRTCRLKSEFKRGTLKYRLDWSPTSSSPTYRRYYKSKCNALSDARRKRKHGSYARVVRLKKKG